MCGECMVEKGGLIMSDSDLKGDNIGLPLSNKANTTANTICIVERLAGPVTCPVTSCSGCVCHCRPI